MQAAWSRRADQKSSQTRLVSDGCLHGYRAKLSLFDRGLRRALPTHTIGRYVSSERSDKQEASETELALLSPGTLFCGRYQVERCLAAGGMGAVYEVVHCATQRRRAMKTMLPGFLSDPEMRARFKLEATITAGIESEHIVEVFDAGIDETTDLPFLVMEYLRGENLAVVLQKRGRLPVDEVVLLLHQASLALERTHAVGIVHRDLKPENLFITRRDDGSVRLKILDFGIAKLVSQSAAFKTTRSFGTPLYMAPEQVRGDGDIDGRADLYAMAQLAFTWLVGHAYWEPEADSATGVYSLLLKVAAGVKEPASLRAEPFGVPLGPAFDDWFARAAHPEMDQRFESAGELVDALAAALGVEVPRPVAVMAREVAVPATKSACASDVQGPTLVGVANPRKQSPPLEQKATSASASRSTRALRVALLGTALGAGVWIMQRGPTTREVEREAHMSHTGPASLLAAAVSTAGGALLGGSSAGAPTVEPRAQPSGTVAGTSEQASSGAPGAGGATFASVKMPVQKPANRSTSEKRQRADTSSVKIDYDPSDLR